MTDVVQLRQNAIQQFRPASVRILFLAESPPSAPDRHFYFADVTRADTLWVELTRTLYPAEFGVTRQERGRKLAWLQRFQQDGYWLLEALPQPIDKKRKEAQIRDRTAQVLETIRAANPDHVILIAAPVWHILQEPVRAAGFTLKQTRAIPFPGHGQQRRFREALQEVLAAIGIGSA